MGIKNTAQKIGLEAYLNKTPKQFLQEMFRSDKFKTQAFVIFTKRDPAKKGLPSALNIKNWGKLLPYTMALNGKHSIQITLKT